MIARSSRVVMALLILAMVFSSAATATSSTSIALSANDQMCFYTNDPTASVPRLCNACLNDVIPAAPTGGCFLDPRGLCLSMSSYNSRCGMASKAYPAASTTYCGTDDTVCSQCLQTSNNTVCVGMDAACICVAACESTSWEQTAKALVHKVEPSSSSTVDANATNFNLGSSSTATYMALFVGAIMVLLLVYVVRRRMGSAKHAMAGHQYAMAASPVNSALPVKPRV